MPLAFEVSGFWALIVTGALILGTLLVYATAGEKVYAAWRKLRPEPPSPPVGPPPVTLTSISAWTPLTQEEPRRLAAIRATYEICNDGDEPITAVTTGVRRERSDRGGHAFAWHESVIRPRSRATVKDVELPPDLFADVHESVAQRAFVFWVRFTDARGVPWEVYRDAATDQHQWLAHPPPLDASSE